MERLIGSAKLYLAALQAQGAKRAPEQQEATPLSLEEARRHLQEAVLDVGVVVWLAHLDD